MTGIIYVIVSGLIAFLMSYLMRCGKVVDPRPIECVLMNPDTFIKIKDKFICINGVYLYKGIKVVQTRYVNANKILAVYKRENEPFAFNYTPYKV